jgi:hypothetical protein
MSAMSSHRQDMDVPAGGKAQEGTDRERKREIDGGSSDDHIDIR